MLILTLIIIFISFLNSNDLPIERYVVYPDFEIDSNYSETSNLIKLKVKEDDFFQFFDIKIYDSFTQNEIYSINNQIHNIELPFQYPKITDLITIRYHQYATDTADLIHNAYGYRCLSTQNNLQEIGKTLILVDYKIEKEIKNELNDYIHTLEKSGIKCDIKRTHRAETFDAKKVQQTMSIVQEYHKLNPDLENIIIIGRVPFALSGHYTPDGHRTESFGAWPTDLLYGAGAKASWTDNDNDTTPPPSFFPWHHNLKGDGKFDQGYIPNNISLNIGRIDMYDLTYFEESESELIKRYFEKNKKFRTGEIIVENNAILDDGWGNSFRERFATEAILNYNAIFGENNFINKKSRNIMAHESYLFFWGGASGGPTSIFDIVYSEEIAKTEFKGVFNIVFGSRAMEWSVENNIMRAIIASEPLALTCRWGIRPFFYTFPMGVGKTIGFCHTLSVNNTIYQSNGLQSFNRTVHQTLIGDPTLKMYYPKQITFKSVTKTSNKYNFEWDLDDQAVAYNIYYKDITNKHYKLLNDGWIRENIFEIEKEFDGNISFLLKKVEKIENSQGYYFDESIGSEWIIEN